MTRKVFVYTDHQSHKRDLRPYNERCVSCGRNNVVQEYGRRCVRCAGDCSCMLEEGNPR